MPASITVAIHRSMIGRLTHAVAVSAVIMPTAHSPLDMGPNARRSPRSIRGPPSDRLGSDRVKPPGEHEPGERKAR